MIRNTSADMNDPINAMLLLAEAMGPGGTEGAIVAQERQGQRELVHSDRLPTDTRSTDAEFAALGFTFGEPDQRDPMFRPATLPEGWVKQASDHDMWSYVVDVQGRRRVSCFYKAAFYDRSAFMRLTSVYEYVGQCAWDGIDPISDGQWATPEALTREAQAAIVRCDEAIEMYSGERYSTDDFGKRHAAEQRVHRERYAAIVARFEAEAGA